MTKTSVLRTILLILRTVTAFCAVLFFGAKCASGEQQRTAREAVEVIYPDTAGRNVQVTVEGTLQAGHTTDLSFPVSGMLESGETKLAPGTHFRKGQLLAQINNREAFTALNRSKGRLSTLVLQTLPDIRSRFPAEVNKWIRFMEQLLPQYLAPEMPPFSSPAERDLMTEKGIPSILSALQQEQAEMAYYFYLAPFDGYVLDVKKHPGSTIRKGTVVAQLAKNGPLQLHLAIPPSVYMNRNEALVSTTEFPVKLPDGTVIGMRGELLSQPQTGRKIPSFIQQVYSVNLTTRRPLKHGTRVTMDMSYRTASGYGVLPAAAINGDRVQIVRKGKLETRQVTIIGKEGDSLVVSGLKNGDAVVSSYRQKADRTVYYFPKK